MNKRLASALLAAVLAVPGSVPAVTLPVAAQTDVMAEADAESNLIFTNDDTVTVNGGSGALTVEGTEQIAKFANLESMTFSTKFTCTASGVNSLFFAGDSTQANHYVSVYVNNGSTIGIEGMTAGGAYAYRTSYSVSGTSFSDEHDLTVTFEANSKVCFYLDGIKVHEASVSSNFLKDAFSNISYVGFGKGGRSSGNNYPLTGTLNGIRVYDYAKTEEDIQREYFAGLLSNVYTADSVFATQNKTGNVTDPEEIAKVKDLTEGSWHVRFRMDGTKTDGLHYLASLSDGDAARDFVALYIQKNGDTWRAGVDAPDKNVGGVVNIADVDVTDGAWHDLVAVREDTSWTFYLDGESLGQTSSSEAGFFNKVTAPDSLATGYCSKENANFHQPLHGSISTMEVYSEALTAGEVSRLSAPLRESGNLGTDTENVYLTEKEAIFSPGDRGSQAYRIPSLLTTDKGTIIAGVDKRNDGPQDGGNIDLVIRRREAGEDEFGEQIRIFDGQTNSDTGRSAFAIDSVMVQDLDEDSPHKGRIHLLVDFCDGVNTILAPGSAQTGNEHLLINGKRYRSLYKDDETQPYVVVENGEYGEVYTTTGSGDSLALGEKTDYTVILSGVAQPFYEFGNLYKDGEYKGNIFISDNGANKGELHMRLYCSIWHFYSDDDGKTWSTPHDITPQIKADWMFFYGVGPGRGVQLENGRLVIPTYSTNRAAIIATQQSTVIVSDDYGETWETKEHPVASVDGIDVSTQTTSINTEAQPVLLNDGKVLLFMRNQSGKVRYALSTDNCESWDWIKSTPINDVYCQLSALHFNGKDGKEYILISNAKGPGRNNGYLTLGEVQADGTVDFNVEKQIEPTGFAYSCLTEIAPAEDGTKRFADHYELNNNPIVMTYFEFDEDYIRAEDVAVETLKPVLNDVSASVDETGKLTVTLTANSRLFVAGTPKMIVQAGGQDIELNAEISEPGTSLSFSGQLPDGFEGVVTFKEMDETAGTISNRSGNTLDVEADVLCDLTLVRPVAVTEYSTQHSASTAPNTDGAAVNAIDGDPTTFWHSRYGHGDTMPQWITVDLGEAIEIDQMNFLNRQSSTNALLKDYKLEGSLDGQEFTTIIESTMLSTQKEQNVVLPRTTARYLRLTCINNYANNDFATIAELSFNKASEGAERTVDTAQLAKAVEIAQAYESVSTEGYWNETAAPLLAEAQAILDGTKTQSQQQIDLLCEDVLSIVEKHVPFDAITEIAEECEQIDSSLYTTKSYQVYAGIVSDIKAGIQQIESRHDLAGKIMNLQIAKEKLVLRSEEPEELDYRLLIQARDKASQIVESSTAYKADTIANLSTLITEANTLMTDENAVQSDVDAKAAAINAAVLNARLSVSKEKLESLN